MTKNQGKKINRQKGDQNSQNKLKYTEIKR